jgi:hypothetical protein
MTTKEEEVEMEWVNVYFALRSATIIVPAEAKKDWRDNDDVYEQVVDRALTRLEREDGIDLLKTHHKYQVEIEEN